MAETVICRYLVHRGREDEFVVLLTAHWPTLRRLELVTDTPARHYRNIDDHDGADDGTTEIVEIFEWADSEAADAAHTHPDVSVIWERMDTLTARMTFPHYAELNV